MHLRKRASRRRDDPLGGDRPVTTYAHPYTPAVPVTVRGRLVFAARTKLFRDTGWTMLAEMAGMASQLVTLVLIARVFSQETYGIFAGTVGLMNVISPFTTIGMGYVLVQRVAGERENADVEAGRAYTTITLGGLVGIGFVLATSWLLIPETSIPVIIALGLGELIFTQITYAGRFCAQALDRPATGARVTSIVWGLRLVAAVLFLTLTSGHTLGAWSIFHMTASFVGAVFTIVVLGRTLMLSPRPSLARVRDVRQGMAYSLTIGATYLKNDADKTLLLTYGKNEAAGLYALAYRVITPLYVPVRALADATFARFFREGSHSATETYALALRTTKIGGAFTLVGGIAVAVCAPLLPVLVGDKWDDAVVVTQFLAFVPFLVALQMYAFNALIGLGKRGTCLAVTVTTSLLNLGLNLLLIPRYTWKGSTAATFIAEAASVAALWVLLRREVHHVAPVRDNLRSI